MKQAKLIILHLQINSQLNIFIWLMGQKGSPVGFFLQPESPFLHFSLKLHELRKIPKHPHSEKAISRRQTLLKAHWLNIHPTHLTFGFWFFTCGRVKNQTLSVLGECLRMNLESIRFHLSYIKYFRGHRGVNLPNLNFCSQTLVVTQTSQRSNIDELKIDIKNPLMILCNDLNNSIFNWQ